MTKTQKTIRCEKCRCALVAVDLEEGEVLRKKKGWTPLCDECQGRDNPDGAVGYLKNIFGMRD